MKAINYLIQESFIDKDIWQAQDLGLKSNDGLYHLNFTKLRPLWLKDAIKKFILFQSAVKTFSTCCSYIVGLRYFCDFILIEYPHIIPVNITRAIIIEYISYLARSHLGTVSKNKALIHLRTFHEITFQEKWLSWSGTPFIFNSDFLKEEYPIPKFIPEPVMAQLQKHIHRLTKRMQHLVTILIETGRRISEICSLPFNCMEQDHDGDYFLHVSDRKFKKHYLIPLSQICINAILEQQQDVKELNEVSQYLFPTPTTYSKTPYIQRASVTSALNKLAHDQKITDVNEKIWHFHPHQFRHTVGTRMVNAGVPHPVIQRFLGHESPEMTARYAHIHNETLKIAFKNYQGKLIDIRGKYHSNESRDEYKEAKWLKQHVMAQALPNGLCTLPVLQQRCPHANACLTCVHFRTDKSFLPQHKLQLEETNKIIETAKQNGWQRQIEMNIAVHDNLSTIIKYLEDQS